MEKENKPKNYNTRILIVSAIVLVAILVLVFSVDKISVSKEFRTAREESAIASEEISNILNESVSNLSLIARYEREGSINDARDLAQEEIDKSDFRNQAAITLATAVQKMAVSASTIDSEPAKTKIVEAVSSQVTAITHILQYNLLLSVLLQEIESKFQPRSSGTDERIEELLGELNAEAEAINRLNGSFTEALKEFDSIVRTKVQ